MMYRRHVAFVASFSVVALILATNETLGGSRAAPGGGVASAHPTFRPSVGRPLHHHRGHNLGAFWPGADGFFYGPSSSYGDPNLDVMPPASGDVRYTDDVPWDAVHRFPPAVAPSDRPYVQECTTQTVTVPRRDGEEQTANVNVLRCY
jgi:hypothetical protein